MLDVREETGRKERCSSFGKFRGRKDEENKSIMGMVTLFSVIGVLDPQAHHRITL